MRNIIALSAIALVPSITFAQQLPISSPRGKVEQTVGLTRIVVDYGRPSRKDRRVFGDLVPYNELWRTGANMCTTVELDNKVLIDEQELPAGKYALLTIPTEGSWTVIFNRNTELSGTEGYDEKQNALMLKAKSMRTSETRETFTIGFDDIIGDNAVLFLDWAGVRVNLRINADATEQGVANIKEALGKKDADFRAYHSSARFYLDRGLGADQALAWAQESVNLDKRFWNQHTLALCLAENGRYKEAIAAAEESMKMSQDANYASYVSMNKEKIELWMQKM